MSNLHIIVYCDDSSKQYAVINSETNILIAGEVYKTPEDFLATMVGLSAELKIMDGMQSVSQDVSNLMEKFHDYLENKTEYKNIVEVNKETLIKLYARFSDYIISDKKYIFALNYKEIFTLNAFGILDQQTKRTTHENIN